MFRPGRFAAVFSEVTKMSETKVDTVVEEESTPNEMEELSEDDLENVAGGWSGNEPGGGGGGG